MGREIQNPNHLPATDRDSEAQSEVPQSLPTGRQAYSEIRNQDDGQKRTR